MNIYLSGAMTAFYKDGEFEKAVLWRMGLVESLKMTDAYFHIFDPTLNAEEMFHLPDENNQLFIDQNIAYLKKTNVCVANFERILESPGTIFELSYCY